MDNMELWNKVKQPPKNVLKPIKGGRLNGKTDISPIWRYQAATEHFGQYGTGWKVDLVSERIVDAVDGEKAHFAHIKFYYKTEDGWSEPTPGFGGSMFVVKE